jgi:hypothetical protein
MKFADTAKLDRKSGVAKWRDLRFLLASATPGRVYMDYSDQISGAGEMLL